MEQLHPPKRRGRPPKNLNSNAQRPKKPIVKPPVAERRQTRHSRAASGPPARKNADTKQDTSDYQITLVDVKSSYNTESGIFTISGLRRGMMEVGPWRSVNTEHATLGKRLREEHDEQPFLSKGSPMRPRIEIDLTLSDSDDGPGDDRAKVPSSSLPSPLSVKRRAEDGEDFLEPTLGVKRQKTNTEPSMRAAHGETHTTLITEDALSTKLLMDSTKTSGTSQGIASKEERVTIDLTPGSPAAEQEFFSSISQPVQPSANDGSSQVALNVVKTLEDGDYEDPNIHTNSGSEAKLHMGDATATSSSSRGIRDSVGNQATDDRYITLGDDDSEATDDIHSLKDTISEQANILDQSLQPFERRRPAADSLKSGQLMEAETERKDFFTAEARSDPGELGNGIKAELAEPGSTANSPYLHEFTEPVQPLTIPVQKIVHEEQIATKQRVNPEPRFVPHDTAVYLEQLTGLEKQTNLGGQQMTLEPQPISEEQVVIPTRQEAPGEHTTHGEEAAALAEQKVLEGQTIPEGQTAANIEHKALEEQTTPDGGALLGKEIAVVEPKTAEDRAISGTQKALEENVIPEEEVEVLVEQKVVVGPVIPEVGLVTLVQQEAAEGQDTCDEQAAIPIMEISIDHVIPHDRHAIPEEQTVIQNELVILHEDAEILDEQAIPDGGVMEIDEQIITDEQVVPDKAVMVLDKQPIPSEDPITDERATPHERDVSDEEAVTSGEQIVPATEEDTMILDEQVIPNEEAIIPGWQIVPNEQAITGEAAKGLDEQITPDQAMILDEQAIPSQDFITSQRVSPRPQVGPDDQVISKGQSGFDEQTPQRIFNQKDIEMAVNEFMHESADDRKEFTHHPRLRRFSANSAVSSRRKLLEPPCISKECPVCKEKFQDMSIPDLRQHILSCLEEERPQSPEYADDEYLGLVHRTTVFLEDLGSDNGVIEGAGDEDLHIDGPSILNGPLSTIAGFRDTPTSDSERTLSDMSDDEQLPGPYEAKDISSDENEFPTVDNIEPITSSKFRRITDPEEFLASLQDPENKSTRSLYRNIQNAADALKTWQDEWLVIEARVAKLQQRKAHNPRAILDPVVFEDQKEADLYGYKWDPNPKKRGQQDPVAQRTGRMVGGRELRRRAPGMKALVVDSDAGTQDGGRRTRSRRGDGASDPNASGVDGGLLAGMQNGPEASSTRRSIKRAADLMDADTPEQSDAPKRRGRPRLNPLPARIRDIRNGDTLSATSTESEGTPAPVVKRRGRPPKNFKPIKPPVNQTTGIGAANTETGKGKQKVGGMGSSGTPGTPVEAGSSGIVKKPKSEKRSAAMQLWWDKRKAQDRARQEATAAAAATAATDANTQVAGPSAQKAGPGKPIGNGAKASAERDHTQVLQKRRGRPPKQPTNLAVEATVADNKVYQPKRRGRPPKSGYKSSLAKPAPTLDGAANDNGLTTTPNPPLGRHTGLEHYQQFAGGDNPDTLAKKRRSLVEDDASSSSKRMKISPPSFDTESDDMESTDPSDSDIDDDGDDSYYG